jgi:uncharacterized protein
MNLSFEWDADKAASNARKHGVGFAEARSVFEDPFAVMQPDPDHSWDEARFRATGRSLFQRLLVVSYTERGRAIRIISVRPATRRERRSYEEK